MAYSDDEEEDVVIQSVAMYYLVDKVESPVSFSVLPLKLDDDGGGDNVEAGDEQVFLHGKADGGLQKIFKPIVAWKVDMEAEQPEFSVLLKEKKWVKLSKPRKSYEEEIRSLLVTIQLLHFLKRNPDSSKKKAWDHLQTVFGTFDISPSEDDLNDHIQLIKLFIEHDEALAKSELLPVYLEGKIKNKNTNEASRRDADLNNFIVDNDEADGGAGDDDEAESDEEPDLFDSVCAICDNGGELLCCEGKCMRSFHATKEAGAESSCRTLGYTRAQVDAIQNFLCKNCQRNQHQCFVCGKLGCSDKSAGAEVFPCLNATCGYFYHPKCVSMLLFPNDELVASEYEKKIAAGESFTCPVHKCFVCKQGENKEDPDLQFAVCRRCPKSYHRKCLPRKIAFDDIEEEDILQRAWEDLLPNRILIYCLKHKIDEDLGTPRRNHIIFPEDPEKKKVIDLHRSVKTVVKKKIHPADLPKSTSSAKPPKVPVKPSRLEEGHTLGKRSRNVDEQFGEARKKIKQSQNSMRPDSQKAELSKVTPKEKPKGHVQPVAPVSTGKDLNKFNSSFPLVDNETLKKVGSLLEKASSITLEDIIKQRTIPSTHSGSWRHVDRSITHGKVEGSCEAVRAALQKLESGSEVADAKIVCEPDVVKQIAKWNSKLKVYLAPFLHGMRYTSFGRHFTKLDKLKEIADKLHHYVQNGDMIVDFCCGANDFSLSMKAKLESVGKQCLFKNFDVIQPKNDFAFEKRDWMTVRPNELPPGSKLIMGLNPPFGVKAALANKFIDKALEFKPKLVILIVPSETERLDLKRNRYDLIWEDGEFLSGKSFYLPGSVDVGDKQIEQWNIKPPPLYLWSNPSWTSKHKAIAMNLGHSWKGQRDDARSETSAGNGVNLHEERNEVNRNLEISEYGNRSSEKRILSDEKTSMDIQDLKKSSEKGEGKTKLNKKTEALTSKMVDDDSDMSISPHGTKFVEEYVPSNPYVESRMALDRSGSQSLLSVGSEKYQDNDMYEKSDEVAQKYIHNGASVHRSLNEAGNIDSVLKAERFQSYARESSPDTYVTKALRASNYLEYERRPGLSNRYQYGVSENQLGSGDNYSSAYGLSNSVTESSVMQRYAPRLDPGRPRDVLRDSALTRLDETSYLRSGPSTHSDPRGLPPATSHYLPRRPSGGWIED